MSGQPGAASLGSASMSEESRHDEVPALTPAQVALYAVAVAIVAGVVEALIQYLFTRGVLHRPIGRDERLLWMAPVAYACVLAIPALIIAVLTRRIPRMAALTVLAFVGWLGVVLLEPNLHLWAIAILSLGLAVATARWATVRWVRTDRAVRRFVPIAVTALALFGAGRETWVRVGEARAVSAMPSPKGGLPNVLIVVWDTVRDLNLSLYGYSRPTTPGLGRLAREGVVFEHAFAVAPWTLPSHASLFTGRLQQELRADVKMPFGPTFPTLAEVLSRRGYRTGGFVANVTYAGAEYGISRGFEHFDDVPISAGSLIASCSVVRRVYSERPVRQWLGLRNTPGRKPASEVNRQFLAWLEHAGEGPWFAFLNYYDAHDPYRPPAPFDTAFGADPNRPWVKVPRDAERRYPKALLDRELDAYDAAIRYLDSQTEALMQDLARRGQLDNTIVIVTSDHGEQFGEHGLLGHANSLYRQLLGVPLVLRAPGRVPAATRVTAAVSLRRMPATVMDLIGHPTDHPFPGRSLVASWAPSGMRHDSGFVRAGLRVSGKTDAHAVIGEGFYFIDDGTGDLEMYDLNDDPLAKTNLLAGARAPAIPGAILRERDSLARLAIARGPIQ